MWRGTFVASHNGQATANKRLRSAVANHIKVHSQEVAKAMRKAKGSVPAGRLRKKRRKKAGGANPYKKGSLLYNFEKMMPGGIKAGWKNKPVSAQRRAATAYQNKKNAAINRAARLRSDVRKAGDRAIFG